MNKPTWICECGEETIQESGKGVKAILICPKCTKEHTKMREVDGSVTLFHSAPGWFRDEWREHMQKVGQKYMNFRQKAFQETIAHIGKEDAYKELTATQKKTENIIESGMRREKLLKKKEISWNWNPGLNKFIGRPAKPVEMGVKK